MANTNEQKNIKKLSKIAWQILKRMLIIFGLLFLLFFCLVYLAKSSFFQHWSKDRVIALIKNEIANDVSIGELSLNPFTGIEANDLLLKDHHDDTLLYVKKLKLGLRQSLISLLKNELYISKLYLDEPYVRICHYNSEEKNNISIFFNQFNKKKNAKGSFKFDLKELVLIQSSGKYIHQENLREIKLANKLVDIKIDSLNFKENLYSFSSLTFQQLDAHLFWPGGQSEGAIKMVDSLLCTLSPIIKIDSLNILESSIRFNAQKNFASPSTPDAFNPNAFLVDSFNFLMTNTLIGDEYYAFDQFSTSFLLDNKYKLHALECTGFIADNKNIKTGNISLRFEESGLNFPIRLQYSSFGDLNYFNDRVYLSGRIEESQIYINDIFYFLPGLRKREFFSKNAFVPLSLRTDFAGRLTSLKAPTLDLKFGDQLIILGNIATRNLDRKGKELINIAVERMSTNMPFVKSLIPGGKIPDNLLSLGELNFRGRFDGYIEDFVAYGNFSTSLGSLRTDMRLDLRPGRTAAHFSGSMNAESFQVGKLFNIKGLDYISFKAFVNNGKGLTKESLYADLSTEINVLKYNGQEYRDISFEGKLNQALLDGKIVSNDPKLKLVFTGRVNQQEEQPIFDFDIFMNHVDLSALGIAKDSVQISGNFKANFKGKNLDYLTGEGNFADLTITSAKFEKPLLIKSIIINQKRVNNEILTDLSSDFFELRAKGDYRLNSLKNVLVGYLHKKYPDLLNQWQIPYTPVSDSATISITGFVNITKALAETIGTKFRCGNTEFDLNFNSQTEVLNFQTNRSDIFFKDLRLHNFSASLDDRNRMHALITFDELSNDSTVICGNGKWSNYLQGEIGDGHLQLFDSTNRQIILALNYDMRLVNKTLTFSLQNKDLYINAIPWKVHPENQVLLTKNEFSITKMELTDSLHFISINDYLDSGLRFQSDGFDISLVNPFIKNKSIAFFGRFLTDIKIPDIKNFENISGSVDIFQLYLNKDNFGPFGLQFSCSDLSSPVDVKIKNIFQEHLIVGEGTFNLPLIPNYQLPKYAFDVNLDIKNLPLSLLQNFITSISETEGNASGKLRLYSANKKVLMDGKMFIEEASTRVNYLGCKFYIVNQHIGFKENLFVFDNITILDELNNPIRLNGNLSHDNLIKFYIDMRIQSPKAQILNTTKQDNIYYYGYAIMNINADFKGSLSATNLNFVATALKGSKLILPVRYEQDAKDTKFVRFVQAKELNQSNQKVASIIKGMNINADLTLTDDAEVSIIFDELAGDIMKGKGRGNLQIKSSRSGEFRVNGNYEIESGQYLFTLLNFVNKPFRIKRGGTIFWSGDPLNADINIEASYDNLYASPYLLIQEYLSANPDQSIEQDAKRRTLIDLSMVLTGSLLKPEIDFNIRFPQLIGELKNYSDTKIRLLENNPDQMNQQVFGLLVFGTFLNTNDPLASTFINNLQSTTINTMSEMLTNQFSLFVSNLLSEAFDDVDFISGVDFNIAYDFGGNKVGETAVEGQELVFSLRHRLWNDQWAVTLGGNYKSTSAFGTNNLFNPESVIEWITPVQGLKLRVYYRGDESIQGPRHRVGAGVNYRKEFENLFDFKKEVKEKLPKNSNKNG